jgi:hypothetical protein
MFYPNSIAAKPDKSKALGWGYSSILTWARGLPSMLAVVQSTTVIAPCNDGNHTFHDNIDNGTRPPFHPHPC